MTDDIVTRLREERWVWVSESALRQDAADEIERLRADRKELLQIARLFADEGMCRMYDEFGTCIHIDGVCDWHGAEHLWESFCMSRGL
jgi:hypothetical protein